MKERNKNINEWKEINKIKSEKEIQLCTVKSKKQGIGKEKQIKRKN